MNVLNYKGYFGSIDYNSDDGLLYGKVLGIKSLISYQGETGKLLEIDFKACIDDYLADCKHSNSIPERPFKGSFNVRISPELHERAAILSRSTNRSLNSFVADAINDKVVQFEQRTSLEKA